MSIEVTILYVLACDGCDAKYAPDPPALSSMDARASAYGKGWRYPRQGGRATGTWDACADCAPGWVPPEDPPAAPAGERVRRNRRITPEFLDETAQVYKDNLKGNPTQAVARAFGVSIRMAGVYVTKAREIGLLPATRKGRKLA